MSGGIFTPVAFHPNAKCVALGAFLAVSYWFAPTKSLLVFVLILIITYILLSWYDYLYGCDQHMMSGGYGLNWQAIFKPQYRNEDVPDDVKLVKNQEFVYLKTVYMFHLFMVAPTLVYAGYKGYKYAKKNNEVTVPFSIVGVAGVMAGMYHGMRLLIPRQTS